MHLKKGSVNEQSNEIIVFVRDIRRHHMKKKDVRLATDIAVITR